MRMNFVFSSIVVIDVTGFLTDIGFPLPGKTTVNTTEFTSTTTTPVTTTVDQDLPDNLGKTSYEWVVK